MTDTLARSDVPASLNGKQMELGKPPTLDRPATPKNYLSPLGEKIFLDRYAWKDGSKQSLAVGDTVIVCVDEATRQREIGTVETLDREAGKAEVRTRDGVMHRVAIEHVDKPLETTPGETMARIAHGIAAVEEEAKRAEWEEKFNWLLEDWKFVPGGRIWAGAGTDQQLTFYNCMPPEQEVLTENGYKAIAEVEVGDYVVTHRNRLRRVLHKFERETEELVYTIKTRKVNFDQLRVTGEHKVLSIRSDWVNKHKSRDGLRLKQEPQWIPAQELRVGDFLAVAHDAATRAAPVLYVSEYLATAAEGATVPSLANAYALEDGKLFKPQQRGDYHGHLTAGGTKYGVTDRLEVDAELCLLFGRWLGDGNVNHRTGTDIPSGIKIVFSLDEKAEADYFAEVITRRFGVPASVKLSSTGRWYDLWANSLPLGQFFKALFGCYSYGKKIPSELMHLPDDLTLELIRGLFGADGYISDNEIGILLANRVLATQLHLLLLRLGYFFSIYENTHKNARHPSYRLSSVSSECAPLYSYFSGHAAPAASQNVQYYLEHDGLRWVRITQINAETYRGPVLDLEVDEDHSFVSAGLVVSNCYVVPSPRDSRGGIVTTLQQMMEIMSRGGGVGINVSSLRPRYSYVKGVNGRSSGAVSWGGLYSFVTGLIEQGGSRRGALMLICNDWHPDVMEFIHSKREAGKITNANISVGISDAFMAAVEADAEWELVFPDTSVPDYDTLWDGDLEAWRAAGRPVNRYKTVRAREMWGQIIESAWASAEPGLWFRERSNKMSNSWYFSSLISTNPCGEQPLPAFGICNLGALNLSRFVEGGAVQWDELRQTVRYAVRFLDNVIDATPYFFEENAAQQGKERRVGLGVMGMAEMLIRLGLRYGSEEGNAFLDELFRVIASEAYLASSDYAAEKGSFPAFDAEQYLQSGYMQGMPEAVRERVREQGVRNVTLLTVAPTGCVAPGTLVSTEQSLRPIVELGDRHGEQWQPMQRRVHTDEGLRETSHFFVNGYRPVRTVTTLRGFTLTATPNHQIRVIDRAGDYLWRRMDALQPDDQLVLKRDTMGVGERVPLKQVSHGVNSRSEQCPAEMTPAFAELLGLYMGDGYLKTTGGLHLVVSHQDPDLLSWVKGRLTTLWGAERHTAVEERIGCWTVTLNGRYIPRFFEANGLAKPKGNHGEGAEGAFLPSAVLRGGREVVAPFLRGLFESDGTITRGTISLTSSSSRLIEQVQVALLALGIVATRRTFPEAESYERFGKRPRYELRILNRREAQKFVEQVGFLGERKRAACADLGAMCDRGDSVAVEPLLQEFYARSAGLPGPTRQQIRGQIGNGAVTQRFVQTMVAEREQLATSGLAHLVAGDFFLDRIATVDEGMSDTFDLSVPDNHTYIANGFVSHNTTGTMTGTSTGVEPYYFWSYFRKSRLGMHEEVVDVVRQYREQHGAEAPLPDHFVTAMDLSPEAHVRVQGTVQRWVDSAISKTANVPNEYTVEQLADLYRLMYDLGCKGGTVYRDGSRDEQVLSVKKEEKKAEVAPVVAAPAPKAAAPLALSPNYTDRGDHKRARPRRLRGATYFIQTPVGKAYVTVNRNGGNEPFEVFANVGKVGSEGAAMSEAIGRLVSLVLRLPSAIPPSERLEMVVDELAGIGGSRSIGFGPNRVTSLPDALAQVLREDLEAHREEGDALLLGEAEPPVQQLNLLETGLKADLCPECGHASFVRAEGCKKCYSCGFSEC